MSKIKKIPAYIKGKVLKFLDFLRKQRRKGFLKQQISLLKNKNISVISNNCNGGVIVSELGLRFNSQFVDLSISEADYVKYLKNFDYYNNCKLVFVDNSNKTYPVAQLDDIIIEFVHYKTKEEALDKWERRKSRINKENMFIILTEQTLCTEQSLCDFDNLPFKNKVVFTYKKYPNLKSAVYLEDYKDNPLGVYMFLDFKNYFSKKRKYDIFDFVAWFNGETDLKKLLR